ncbi:peptidylprolyl isomerase [Dokdonia sp.]|uniref:peptidylprolyl isomerase n=1 Tax=Dokdonia sp. TaxID=2024995 RepID=UPI003267AD67
MIKYLHVFLLLASFSLCHAQETTDVLLIINGQDVTVDEFKAVYLKNISLVQDDSQKDPRSYLELFKEYKLKVQEAYALDLHKKPAYIKELSGYRTQLIKNYLTDVEVTESLVKEAYDRTTTEVKARHILVKVTPDASPSDTLKAYTKIIQARDRIEAGEDFQKIAKTYSEDPSAASNGGELGWFKAFKMVYAFESAAFLTIPGQVSKPFKTRFGYHIVQTTDKRQARGAIQVAHIMLALKQTDTTLNPEKRIQEIYALLEQGTSFEKLAQTHSDDKRSAVKGGILDRFESGQLSSKIFENKVFNIKNQNDYTKPFKSEFGWHIAKLIKKYPIGSYEEERNALEEKVKRDNRSKQISDTLQSKLRTYYNVKENSNLQAYFISRIPDADFSTKKWKYTPQKNEENEVAFKIKDTVFSYKSLGEYLERFQRTSGYATKDAFVKDQTFIWTNKMIKQYHEDHLEEADPEFNALMREYREGLLLFELLETKVWNVAKTDTVGLKKYFQEHKEVYRVPETVNMMMITASKKGTLSRIKKLLQKGKTREEIEKTINTDQKVHVLFTNRKVAVTDTTYIVSDFKPSKGISKVYDYNNDYVLYNVTEVIPSQLKTLEETKGIVINDFQKEIEHNWLQGLKEKADIRVNETVLNRFINTLK